MNTIKIVLITLLFIPAVGFSKNSALSDAQESYKKLDKIFVDSRVNRTYKPPRLKNKTVASLFEILTDSNTVLKSNKLTTKDLGQLMDFCDGVNSLHKSYHMNNLVSLATLDVSFQERQKKAQKHMENNLFNYQDEMFRLLSFSVSCAEKQNELLLKFWANLDDSERTDIRKNGIKQARLGLFQVFLGASMSLDEEKLRVKNRTLLLQSLSDSAQSYAEVLTLKHRAKVVEVIQNSDFVKSKKNSKYGQHILQMMSNKDCDNFCKL